MNGFQWAKLSTGFLIPYNFSVSSELHYLPVHHPTWGDILLNSFFFFLADETPAGRVGPTRKSHSCRVILVLITSRDLPKDGISCVVTKPARSYTKFKCQFCLYLPFKEGPSLSQVSKVISNVMSSLWSDKLSRVHKTHIITVYLLGFFLNYYQYFLP